MTKLFITGTIFIFLMGFLILFGNTPNKGENIFNVLLKYWLIAWSMFIGMTAISLILYGTEAIDKFFL